MSRTRASAIASIACGLVAALGGHAWAAPPPEPLRVVTFDEEPWVMRKGALTYGFHADLWDAIAAEAGLSYEFDFVETWPEMLREVTAGTADVAVQQHAARAARELEMDFTHEVLEDGLQVVIAEESLVGRSMIQALASAETMGLLALAAISVLLVSHLLWFVERRQRDPVFAQEYGPGIRGAMEWAIHTLVGRTEFVSKNRLSRVLSTAWLFVAAFGFSAWVAHLASALTVNQLRSPIDGVHDLRGHTVGAWDFGKQKQFLGSRGIDSRLTQDTPSLLRMVQVGEVDALLMDIGNAHYWVRNSDLGLALAGPPQSTGSIAYALPQGSPHRETINRALLKLREDGTYALIRDRYLHDER